MTGLAALAGSAGRPTLASVLRDWLPRQRWFAGKARRLEGLRVHDVAVLDDGAVLLVLVDVDYADGGTERYHLPLALAGDDEPAADDIVARLPEGAVVDAGAVPAACIQLAQLCVGQERPATSAGAVLVPTPVGDWRPPSDAAVRRLGGEQSNTSVVLAEAAVLKLFRKLEAGVNPDVELTRALTDAGQRSVPTQYGSLELHEEPLPPDGPTVLAVLSELVAGARDGWEVATGEVSGLADGGPHPAGGLLDGAEPLGETVAGTHASLADALGRQEASIAVRERWIAGMRAQALRVLDLAEDRAPVEAAAVLDRRAEILGAFDGLLALDDSGPLIRVHGDLHLGQVLLGDDGWRLLDFEGEPARPLSERREPHSPLKDVAGMLRSFDYAAAQASATGQVENWRLAVRRRFLAGYERVAVPAGLVPADTGPRGRLCALLELDKAVYELGYELASRPDWVRVPVAGILTALDRTSTAAEEH